MALAKAHGQPIVPQGGMTGLVGGATPGEGEIAISLERMSGVEEIDTVSGTITALAGTPLQVVQEAAEDAGFIFLALTLDRVEPAPSTVTSPPTPAATRFCVTT
jgi:FAD/FMN-containing dehydrogenase|tara:strand:+ start:4232 stop:4543 length:312 start_codon:yes stop_codon:yes gene_type:complete